MQGDKKDEKPSEPSMQIDLRIVHVTADTCIDESQKDEKQGEGADNAGQQGGETPAVVEQAEEPGPGVGASSCRSRSRSEE